MSALDQITLQGFKSIRELNEFGLGKVNVMIGANGAGKSNLVDFFRMLRAMAEGGLEKFVTISGGADGFFFNGPKETRQMSASLAFGENAFRFSLEPAASSEIVITNQGTHGPEVDREPLYRASSQIVVTYQGTFWKGGSNPRWIERGGGGKESELRNWRGHESKYGVPLSVQGCIFQEVASWIVYHFHDTGSTAPMRRDQSPNDYHELRSDASNLAPLLLNMQALNPARYQRIRETIQLIAPFFDDFLLEPEMKGPREVLRLQWRLKASTFPFQPWQFSDGTIRFICLATALLQPRPPSTIVIDEPELGLQPVALEVLAALIHETSRRTQLIISTQSAPLLDYFEPEHVIVVERSEGASVFHRLERDALEHWIADYSLGQLVRKNVIETGPAHA
jgi:predicted ATPase